MDIAEQEAVGAASRTGEPRRVRCYAVALCVAALAAGVVLLASGAVRPAPGPVLLLAVAAALCVNRVVLFPTEHASTAEAAVLLAAVVGFRHDAVYLGPLLVGVLVGPLDTVHWEPATRDGAGRWLGAPFAAVATTIATSVVALAAEAPGTVTAAAWIVAGRAVCVGRPATVARRVTGRWRSWC